MNRVLGVLLIVAAALAPRGAWAQEAEAAEESAWTLGGNVGVSLNQASFSNWASGGENSVGLDAQFNYSADYKADAHILNNRAELAYGFTNTQTTGNRKSNDKIYLSSTYGYQIANNLYLSALFTFQSQFADGYSYAADGSRTLTSAIMAPGYLTLGGGVTWTPKEWFTATFTPATWREVFVLDGELSDLGSYGVEAGSRSFAEAGANLQMTVNKDICKNVNMYSRVILFSDYLNNPQNVDVNFELQLNMTINEWLSAFVSTNLVYDDNINLLRNDGTTGPALQFKENLGIGLQLKL